MVDNCVKQPDVLDSQIRFSYIFSFFTVICYADRALVAADFTQCLNLFFHVIIFNENKHLDFLSVGTSMPRNAFVRGAHPTFCSFLVGLQYKLTIINDFVN